MRTILLALLLSCSTAYADNYIESEEGKIVLSALPGCGGPNDSSNLLYGALERPDGTGDIICWKYEDMVHVFIGKKHLAFLPNEVKTDGPSAAPSPSCSDRSSHPGRISL